MEEVTARPAASGFNHEDRKGFIFPLVSPRHCGRCLRLPHGSGVGKCQGGQAHAAPVCVWAHGTGADSNVAPRHSLASSQEAFGTRFRL